MHWVSIKDQLPDEDVRVLTYNAWRDQFVVNYIVFLPDPIWGCTTEREQKDITHWMTLTKPPGD